MCGYITGEMKPADREFIKEESDEEKWHLLW